MMNSKAFAIVCGCLFTATMQSCMMMKDKDTHWERIEWLNIPAADSTLASPLEPAHYEAKYVGHDAVFIDRKYSVEHVGDLSSWDYYQVSKLRYIVLNPEADWLTTFRISIDNEDQTLDSIYLAITSPEGVTRHFGHKDLFVEVKVGDETEYKFVYPDVKKGSMVEEGYIRRTTSLERFFINQQTFHLRASVPTENVSFKYIFPASWDLRFKRTSDDTEPPNALSFHKESNSHILELQGRQMGVWTDEPWSPYKAEASPHIKCAVSAANSLHFTYEQPSTWGDLLKGTRLPSDELAELREDAELKALALSVTENAKTNFEKADAVNRWVQQNLEIDECRKCEYDDVLEKGKGSFKHLMEITMGMMQAVGFKSQLIFIHPADEGYFDHRFVTIKELINPGVVAIADKDTLVVFPYIKNLPAGLLLSEWQERPAIYLDAGDRAVIGKSPGSAISENTQEEEYELLIDDEGSIKVKEVTYFRGLSAYGMRTVLAKLSGSQLEDAMQELLTYEEGDVKLEDYEIEYMDDYTKPLTITLQYTIDNLVTVTPDEVIFQTDGLFAPSSERKYKLETEDRKNPIRIYADELNIKRITIEHPREWNLDTKLKAVDFKNLFGELEATYTSEAGRLVVEQRRLLKEADAPKEKITDLMQVMGKRSQLEVPTLIFTVSEM